MKKSDEFFEPFKIDQETQEKMKKRMLDLLLYFKSFCEKYNLRFWLIGGGAIGAVREHGFVPWDDDIDVQMPLPDYQRLIELWPKYGDKDRYVFCKTNREVNYHHAYISIRDPETTLICAYNKNNDICQGIGLEIGCMYPTPQSKILQYLQIINGFVYALFNNQRLPNNRGDFIRFMSKVAYAIVRSKRVQDNLWIWAEKQISKYKWNECTYVKELWGKTSFYNFPRTWYDSVVLFDFEGHKMPLPAGYHEYLSLIFGDYMKRPPETERVPKRELIFVDMDHPYTDYKGIYYCIDE